MAGSGILFAYDFSERSELAAKRAFQLAREHGKTVHAVHVADEAFPEWKWLPDYHQDSELSIIDRLKQAVRERLKSQLGPLAAEYGVALEVYAGFGYVAEQLHSIGLKTDSRMMVIGAHGRHRVRNIMLGATAEQLLWYLEPPTLVVRNESSEPYSRILIAADFCEESEAAMAQVASWFPDANVTVLHVIDDRSTERLEDLVTTRESRGKEAKEDEEAARTKLREMVSRSSLKDAKVEIHVVRGHPVEEVARQADTLGADLVAMGGHGRSRLTRWLPGRVASRLVHSLPCDVMLARAG